MLEKRQIINFLYVLSFPFFGIGQYVSATRSPSIGFLVSALPPLAILLFHLVDKLYQREVEVIVNRRYWWGLLLLIFLCASLFVSYRKGLPDLSLPVAVGISVLLLLPFHGFIVWHDYNRKADKNHFADLTLLGLSLLLLINLVGFFGLGLVNQTHALSGRINFPFLGGVYDGSNLLVVISLILFLYIKQRKFSILPTAFLLAFLAVNFVLIFMINSRLGIMLMLVVIVLFATNVIQRSKGIFLISLFTVPILLSSGLLIFKLLQIPPFSSLVQRVGLVDVVTFHGRSFLWENALNWLLFDQRGFFFGNGYQGHYFIDLISDVAQRWNQEDLHVMHLHSSSLEMMVSQGVIPFLIFIVLTYKIYTYYKGQYIKSNEDGYFFAAIVFLIFLMQVDSFVYMNSLGFFIWAALLARTVIKREGEETDKAKSTEKQSDVYHYSGT